MLHWAVRRRHLAIPDEVVCHINQCHEGHTCRWDPQPFSTRIFPSRSSILFNSEAPQSPGNPSTSTTLEMALLKRQSVTYQIFDDQSPTMWNSFVGNWTRYPADGFNNNTITATPTTGASLSFSFSGTKVVDH